MPSPKLEKFLWERERETLETVLRGQQRDVLMFWMLQHHDDALSIQTMQHLHDLTLPVELSTTVSVAKVKYLAQTVIEASVALRRGGNAAVCHQLSELVDLCTRYIAHIDARPART